MKIHSIQFKFLITIISAMLAITLFIGGLGIYEVDHFVQQQAESFVKASCEKEATQVNDIFGDMEKSVNIMSGYILSFLDDEKDIESRELQNKIVQSADKMFADVTNNTVGAVAYYLRFAPEVSDSITGFFYSKRPGGEAYFPHEITDLSCYDKDDTEHVGWYWQPYEAGEPVWMQPYHNKNNDIMMISYVVPLYVEERFVGVVGMDFDYTVLTDHVHKIKIYENGFAHLMVDGTPVCHEEDGSLPYVQEEYLQVSAELMNGMTLMLSACYDDIMQSRREIIIRILPTMLFLTVAFGLVAVFMARKIVEPLKMLTEASKKLADGDYNVEPIRSNTYEIQLLGTAFENMAMHLREHEKLQYFLAYMDSLTGLRNTTSYKVWVSDFNKEIQNNNMDFGVMVLDVNYLKETNDKYGHDAGDKLIMAVAKRISDTFKRSPVFRIGGDEFLVILQNRDLEEYEQLCEAFDAECAVEYIETDKGNIPISIARGFAKYNFAMDKQFVDVFNRADDAMYQHKRKMKSK